MSQGGYPGGLGGDLGGGGGYRGGYPKYPISWGVGGRGVYLPHYPGEGGYRGGYLKYLISWGEGGRGGKYPKILQNPTLRGDWVVLRGKGVILYPLG